MNQQFSFQIERLKTPIGQMLIVTEREENVRAVDWTDCQERLHRLSRIHYGQQSFTIEQSQSSSKAAAALDLYFQGELAAIDELTVKTGGTPFQSDVWSALRSIPCGTTTSYAAVANRIDRAAAIRAVGAANGSNPVGVVVPCHRVIGSYGSLTGYAGGMERKKWLLRHERVHDREFRQ